MAPRLGSRVLWRRVRGCSWWKTVLQAIRDAGCTVNDAVVLFDRQQGGADLLAGAGVTLHAVTDRATAMDVARSEGLLDDTALESVEAYFLDARAWHAERGLEFTDEFTELTKS